MHHPATNPALSYRPEVDGLRTVAVVPVVLFHAGFPGLSGGFVGVDIFFVISGYLIGTIILRECAENRFSLLRFYERRARRILPALFFVLLACLPAAILFMLPWQLIEFGRSLIATALFASNILFWRESGYFEASAEEKPLLHTWSLAVEEQFYIFFPLAILLFWRFGARTTGWAIFIAAVISLTLSEWGWRNQPDANFYLLPTRAWELLAGAGVALWAVRTPDKGPVTPRLWTKAAGIVGLGLLVGSVVFLNAQTPFPSLYTVFPVLGSVLVLLFAHHDTPAGWLLARKPFVAIGLISYSFYLWHQPLFAFARLTSETDHPQPWLMAGLTGLSVVLAYGTWKFIEAPFRKADLFSRRRIFQLSAAGIVASVVLGAGLIGFRGLVFLYPAHTHDFIAVSPLERGDYVKEPYIAEVENRSFDPERPKLMIVGDSFSQDFYNMIRETGAFPGYSISAHYVPTRCQIYYGTEDISGFVAPSDRALCHRVRRAQGALERIAEADVVVFAARWRPWTIERLADSLAHLSLSDTQQIFVLSNKSFDDNIDRFLGQEADTLAALRQPIPEGLILRNDLLRAAVPPGVTFVDIPRALCDTQTACPVFTPDARLISYDGHHLTPAGARFAGARLFARSPLSVFAPE